jgi:hypothetical protein
VPSALERVECAAARGRHHLGRARALERDQRELDALVDELDIRGRVLGEPLEILLAIRRVHDEQHVVGASIHEKIVDDAALGPQHDAVLDAANRKRGHGVRRHPIDERDGARPAYQELAHVRHVEEPRGAANRLMLGDDARVLERHLPSGERHELRAERRVTVVEGRAQQCRFGHETPGRSDRRCVDASRTFGAERRARRRSQRGR